MTLNTADQSLLVQQAIETRHSIRKYKQEPIPQQDLNKILSWSGYHQVHGTFNHGVSM